MLGEVGEDVLGAGDQGSGAGSDQLVRASRGGAGHRPRHCEQRSLEAGCPVAGAQRAAACRGLDQERALRQAGDNPAAAEEYLPD